MNESQYNTFKEEIKDHIDEVIQIKVNGKIDKISSKLDAFIVRADPAVALFENLTWFKKTLIALVVFLGTLAMVWTWIAGLLSKK